MGSGDGGVWGVDTDGEVEGGDEMTDREMEERKWIDLTAIPWSLLAQTEGSTRRQLSKERTPNVSVMHQVTCYDLTDRHGKLFY